jgi:hypothetical protein
MSAAADARNAGRAPEKADWLEMRAEEEFAADRAISPVLRQFRGLASGGGRPCPSRADVKLSPPELTQAKLQQEVVERLARLGIDTSWCGSRCKTGAGDVSGVAASVHELGNIADGEPPGPATIWSGLQLRIENMHGRVRNLAFAVVSFTVALACFSFADASIRLRRRWVKWAWFGAGIAFAAVTFLVIVLCLDTEGWRWMLLGLFGTPLFGLLLWQVFVAAERKGWIHPRADPGHVHPDAFGAETSAILATVLPHESSRLTTFIVVALAITVVFSALSALGYSLADTQADEMALRARGYAAEMAKHSDFLGRAKERIGQLATNLECRARLAATNQRLDRFHSEEDEGNAQRLRDGTICESRWNDDVDDPSVGADADPDFPQKIVRWAGRIATPATVNEAPSIAEFRMWKSFAMRDASAAHSLALRHTATRFLATLTLFAIALYMLGQALGMGRHRSAYVLTAAGVLFAVVGMGLCGAFARLAQDTEPPPDKCAAKEPVLRKERSEWWARSAYDYAAGMKYLKIQAGAHLPRLRRRSAAGFRRCGAAARICGNLGGISRFRRTL